VSPESSTVRIEHVAFWTEELERLVDFYEKYFGAAAGSKYLNPAKGYESRFLSFEGGARIEVMRSATLNPVKHAPQYGAWRNSRRASGRMASTSWMAPDIPGTATLRASSWTPMETALRLRFRRLA
jgi:catechol 2,3-dioxygenase-like lactoylglutathione lyase family enzyme